MRIAGLRVASTAFALVATLHCGGDGNAGVAAPTKNVAPPTPSELPIVAMRLVARSGGKTIETFSVGADGSVAVFGKPTATLRDDRLVCLNGDELLHVTAGGKVIVRGDLAAHFSPTDAFVLEPSYGDWSMNVRDDGAPEITTRKEGRGAVDEARWEPFAPRARRTAAMLVAILMTGAFARCSAKTP